jgi:hypothetical protein
MSASRHRRRELSMTVSLPSADPGRCPGDLAGRPAEPADSSPDAACSSAFAVDSPSAGGSSANDSGSSANRADSPGGDMGQREVATPWMVGVLATELTRSTGRRRNSDTSATTTGVSAALTSVPAPHSREASNDAAAEATLAMTSVWIEMPLLGFFLFGGLATPLSNADQPPNPVKSGHRSELRPMGAQTSWVPDSTGISSRQLIGAGGGAARPHCCGCHAMQYTVRHACCTSVLRTFGRWRRRSPRAPWSPFGVE